MAKGLSDIGSLDLRSLEILLVVYREKSFTSAAERLGISQSVVSYGIDKLRKVIGDPLFVREAGQTLPTEKCDALVALSDGMILRIEDLRSTTAFVPAHAAEKLVIACNYYERLLMIPSIVAAFRQQAPQMQIEIIDASGNGHEKLLNRDADILIGPFRRNDVGFHTRDLMTDNYACLINPEHPAAKTDLTLADYLKLEHIVVTYGGKWKSLYLTELEQMGNPIVPALKVPSPAGIEELVTGSQLVATLPEGLARKISGHLKVVQCPVQTRLPIRLVWTARRHHSPMMQWVRQMMAEAITELKPAD